MASCRSQIHNRRVHQTLQMETPTITRKGQQECVTYELAVLLPKSRLQARNAKVDMNCIESLPSSECIIINATTGCSSNPLSTKAWNPTHTHTQTKTPNAHTHTHTRILSHVKWYNESASSTFSQHWISLSFCESDHVEASM
jgi:hypothetical protein